MKFKLVFVLALFLFQSLNAMASEISASSTLELAKYEVGGGSTFSSGRETTQTLQVYAAHLLNSKFAVSGVFSAYSKSAIADLYTGVGFQYYFLNMGRTTFLASQSLLVTLPTNNNYFGRTGLGMLYMIKPSIGFKGVIESGYSLKDTSNSSLDLFGYFTFFI